MSCATLIARPEHRGGQAMVEFLIVIPVMLLLVFGTLQFGLIYQAKITLNYAAFEAAREGSLANADIGAIENGFVRGMMPIHPNMQIRTFTWTTTGSPPASRLAGNRVMSTSERVDRVRNVRQALHDEVSQQLVQIRIINPTEAAFTEHGVAARSLAGLPAGVPSGRQWIPNDNLMYRDAARGGASGMNVQDANLLKVHVGYCFELIVPLANRVLNGMMRYAAPPPPPGGGRDMGLLPQQQNFGPQPSGTFARHCVEYGSRKSDRSIPSYSIPLYSQAVIRMQSPAVRAPASARKSGGYVCAGYCP